MTKEQAIHTLSILLHPAHYGGGKPTLDDSEIREALKYAIQAIHRQPDFQNIGRKGGLATKAIHGPEYFRRIGKLGGRPRRKGKE